MDHELSYAYVFLHIKNMQIISWTVFNIILALLRVVLVFSMCFGIQKLYTIGGFSQFCKDVSKKHNISLICMNVLDEKNTFYGCCKEKCLPKNQRYESHNPLKFDNYGVGIEFLYMVIDEFVFFLVLWVFEG